MAVHRGQGLLSYMHHGEVMKMSLNEDAREGGRGIVTDLNTTKELLNEALVAHDEGHHAVVRNDILDVMSTLNHVGRTVNQLLEEVLVYLQGIHRLADIEDIIAREKAAREKIIDIQAFLEMKEEN